MKASKFTEPQSAFVLRQAEEGTPVAGVCRKAGISDATFYNWRNKYAGLKPSEMAAAARGRERKTEADRRLPCHWARPCCRTSSQKSIEAWPQSRTCRQIAQRVESIDRARLFDPWDRSSALRSTSQSAATRRISDITKGKTVGERKLWSCNISLATPPSAVRLPLSCVASDFGNETQHSTFTNSIARRLNFS